MEDIKPGSEVIAEPNPQVPEKKSIIDRIDRDALSKHIIETLQRDISDREEYGLFSRMEYDELAYSGYKQRTDDPWPNAANYCVPITRVLVDTGHANVMGGIYSNREKVVDVKGVGPEDFRTAYQLAAVLNWQQKNSIDDSYSVIDHTVQRAFKHGNGAIKVVQQKSVRWIHTPIEHLFFSIDIKGVQPKDSDHIYELISLTDNEKIERMQMKDAAGKPIYEGLENLPKGNTIGFSSSIEKLQITSDKISGSSINRRWSRDLSHILECYQTWWHKNEDGSYEPIELVVWIAPFGGSILRIVENTEIDDETEDAIRPYSLKWRPYPRTDRFIGDSLPMIIRSIQEEANHETNQIINAGDKLIDPPKFYDPNSGFDPEESDQTPGGWYPLRNPSQNLFMPNQNYSAIFERKIQEHWEYAQRITGFTELFQGRSQESSRTLGEAQIRTGKTEIRFLDIYNRFEDGWNELWALTHHFNKKYMPREVKVAVVGTGDIVSVKEIFPEGKQGKFNFSFSSAPRSEKLDARSNVVQFYEIASRSPIAAKSIGVQWKLLKMVADAFDIPNMESIISKPKEASVLSPQEAIQRIMSGQYDIAPDPGVDAADYTLRLALFMKTDAFKFAGQEEKQAIMVLLRRIQNIELGQKIAMMDAMTIRNRIQSEQAIGAQMQGMGQGGAPAIPGGQQS